LILVCGATGDCKSGSSITKCWELDRDENNQPRFSIKEDPHDPENRIITHATDFVRIMNTQQLPKGSCLMWDEIGVDADNREYFSLKNRLVKKVFQTFRYKNLILFMTVPDFKSVDIGVRKLAHGYLEMYGQAFRGKCARGKFQWIQTNPKTGKVYFKYPRWVDKNGNIQMLRNYYIPKPPKHLEKVYKKMKDRVNQSWYKDYDRQLMYMKAFVDEKQSGKTSIGDLKDEALKVKEQLFDSEKDKFVDVLVESQLGVSSSRAKQVTKLLNVLYERGEITV